VPAPLVETVRWSSSPAGPGDGGRDVVESTHRGHVAVVGPAGLVSALGDPDRPTFVRSVAKPFQAAAALALLRAGHDPSSPGDLDDRSVAVSWASHRGEAAQLAAVRRLLARSGTDERALTTPPERPPADPATPPARIAHNCSGQHALFALAGAAIGCRRADLLRPDGPLQRPVLDALGRAFGPVSAVATDGCGAPTVAVPLRAVATAYRDLAGSAALDLRSVRDAGLAHPDLVGGSGRLESELLRAGIVAKPGAEGIFALGWRDRDGAQWGVAVRIEDGGARAAPVVVAALLAALGPPAVNRWEPPPILGGGRPAGAVRAVPAVRELSRVVAPPAVSPPR
jgi:L-asparaginase II